MGEEQKEKEGDGGSRFGGRWLEAVYIRSDMRERGGEPGCVELCCMIAYMEDPESVSIASALALEFALR